MKKFLIVLAAISAMSSSAFAIDQVKLTSGEVVEGKVLSDVPNRHVDIQLLNGTKKRFEYTQVASVERDVPSNKDTDTYGSDRRVFFGVNLGGFKVLDNGGGDVLFNYGARFGVNTAQMGDFAKFAFSLAYNRAKQTSGVNSVTYNEIMVQLLFRKVANSGFYFGPEAGLAIVGTDFAGTSNSATSFDFGGLVGYDYYFSPSFSMGPEVHYTSVASNNSNGLTMNSFAPLKFLLSATFHFE